MPGKTGMGLVVLPGRRNRGAGRRGMGLESCGPRNGDGLARDAGALINDFDPQDAVNYAIAASILKLTIKGDSNLVTAGEIAAVASAADGGTRVAR